MSHTATHDQGATTAPNAYRLLWAGFMAILASGVGFSVRGGILGQWAEQFGFTMTELGAITGGGLTGFGIVIILSSLIADKVGYGRLMVAAFVCHFLSAIMTLGTPIAFQSGGKNAAFYCLSISMFIFAIGNGLCEAVVNPLTATLFPKNKTHYLNILHAGWPAGLVIGGLAAYFMGAQVDGGEIIRKAVDWKIQMSLFLIPVVIYGVMLLGQPFPRSEANAAGATLGSMLSTLVAPLMLILIVIHMMVGYVELGTDSWIANITGSIMNDPARGIALMVYTSTLMFILRFCAGPIVHRISPLGLLFASAILGAIGLTLLSNASTIQACVIAATVYAAGKTFLWPTMLGVASEQFPKGGAISIGVLGGVGMLSAGLLGGPGIGFKQDYNASAKLKAEAPETFERYKAANENRFLTYSTIGLDGSKVKTLEDDGKDLAKGIENLQATNKSDKKLSELDAWWQSSKEFSANDKPLVQDAGVYGGRMALKLTAYIPTVMAILYLLLLLYFRTQGGYRPKTVDETSAATH